ncbi:MAG: primosomal protein N' [Candidatus Bipolaricaulota bacterium]|nr:primosomal protein N' [Candidatus Bipolaricaulota bacterium]
MIARVLLPLPVDKGFDFSVPAALSVSVGNRVKVRFHGRERWGIVTALPEKSAHPGELEPVIEVADGPAFSQGGLLFCRQVAERWLAPLGLLVNRALPRRISRREERQFALGVDLSEAVSRLDSLAKRAPRQAQLLRFLLASGPCNESSLRNELGSVRRSLDRLLEKGLLREAKPTAATGKRVDQKRWTDEFLEQFPHTGKVLLFSRRRWGAYPPLIETTLATSQTALVLAPERLLAAQLASYLQGQLDCEIGLYHSGLPAGQQGRVWERARRGELGLIVGTRSALFLPIERLGLVIVDEEQDRNYKQDGQLPYYHGREVAVDRGKDGLVVLGSAAPSLEVFHAGGSDGVKLIRPRDKRRGLAVQVVDMQGKREVLSPQLIEGIRHSLSSKKRVLLTVNRRGYFQAVLCKNCGHPLRCPSCGTNLTYDVNRAQLVCHTCGRVLEGMKCPRCGSRALRFVGMGSARLEAEVRKEFPQAKIARIDADIMGSHDYAGAVRLLFNGGSDIVVGTSMVAKGPPIPRVGLVGGLGVDGLLALPDFRAAERTYQYIVGLSERLQQGELIIQTHYPDHHAVLAAVNNDYDGFYKQESTERRGLFYPPFSRLARLIAPNNRVERTAEVLQGFPVQVLGPVPVYGRRGHRQFLLKGKTFSLVREACVAAMQQIHGLEVDLDPVRF